LAALETTRIGPPAPCVGVDPEDVVNDELTALVIALPAVSLTPVEIVAV